MTLVSEIALGIEFLYSVRLPMSVNDGRPSKRWMDYLGHWAVSATDLKIRRKAIDPLVSIDSVVIGLHRKWLGLGLGVASSVSDQSTGHCELSRLE